jgi:osmotically inducible protein OsmC
LSFRLTRTAQATWKGSVPDGGGRIGLGSGAYEGPFSLRARVEEVERATNPEELIAASVRLEEQDGRFSITLIQLRTTAQVQGISEEQFLELAQQAKATCPVSRALEGATIRLDAALAGNEAPAGS